MATAAMAIPFAIDESGAVATTQSGVQQLSDRVTALASTQPGERVMQVQFGVDTASLLFSLGNPAATQQLALALGDAMKVYEPGAVLTGIVPVSNAASTGVARIVATAVAASSQGTTSTTSGVVVRADGTVITTS